MSIYVKGKEVRENELDKKIEISFHDLNELGQKRFFEENKDLFLLDAITSYYKNIRECAKKYAQEECSNEVLNQVIWGLYAKGNRYIRLLLELLNNPKLKLADNIQIEFANSGNYLLKEWLVKKYTRTSNSILNVILGNELDNFLKNETGLVDAIIMHPEFKLTLEGTYYGFGRIEKVIARIQELKGKTM